MDIRFAATPGDCGFDEGNPMDWRWPNEARLAVGLVVHLESGLDTPRSIDEVMYGYSSGLPRLVRLLDEYSCKATWLCTPEMTKAAAMLAPPLLRNAEHWHDGPIVAGLRQRGHEIALEIPGEVARPVWQYEHPGRPSREVYEDQALPEWLARTAALAEQTGVAPLGWLAEGDPELSTLVTLVRQGYLWRLRYSRVERPHWQSGIGPNRLAVLPYCADVGDQIFRTAPWLQPDHWLQYLIDSFDTLYDEGADAPRMLSVPLHPGLIGRPGRIKALEQFLQYASSQDGTWIARCSEIAGQFGAAQAP